MVEDITKVKKIVLGLDVSTSCIGISIVGVTDNDEFVPVKVTHLRLKVSSKLKDTEALFVKSKMFRDELETFKEYSITDVVIEEPLVSSNNQMTVATLLRFNGMIAQSVYDCLGIVPEFISSYDARKYTMPSLLAVRRYNKKGEEYPAKKIMDAIRKDELVLFGDYPFDCAKKYILWNFISEKFPSINWVYDKKNELKAENFDASDSLVCVMGYINSLKYKEETPTIIESSHEDGVIKYTVSFCGERFAKRIELL